MTNGDDEGIGWWTYTKVGAILLAGVVAMVFLPRAVEGTSGSDLGWMVAFMLGIGGVALVLGFREFRKRQLMLNTPTSKVRSLAVGDVEVKGEAEPVDEPLTSPLTNTEACVYKLEIEKETKDDEGTEWSTVLEFQRQVDFTVDDGTGQVRVEPDEAELDVETEAVEHTQRGEQPPSGIQDWATSDAGQDLIDTEIPRDEGAEDGISGKVTDVVESQVRSRAKRYLTEEGKRDRRYTEQVLGVGESAYVFGGAYPKEGQARATNVENLVIREHEGTGQFVVSDKSEAQRAEEGLVAVAVLLAMGIALVPTGVLALLELLGVV